MIETKERDFSICEIFREWFSENKHRFNQKFTIPYYKDREYNHLEIDFENVAKEIRCWVNEHLTLEIASVYDNEIIDFIVDFECGVRRGRNRKYYCVFCDPPTYYNTPKELVIEHTFERFLEWANKKFTINHVLKLEYCDGWCASKILSKKELEKNPIKKEEQTGENAVLIVPMINGAGDPVLYGTPKTRAEKRVLRKMERK